jgi:hypothetical protein
MAVLPALAFCVRFRGLVGSESLLEHFSDGLIRPGEVAEWPNAAVLKTVVPQGTVSSNLTLSAATPPTQCVPPLILTEPGVGYRCAAID